ncbi:MAG: tRNA (adenosine(37)-N6)-threonylcarbamoyltransferase complex dimerization subunit type 1 TsaB [Janthinobacterium lividum]
MLLVIETAFALSVAMLDEDRIVAEEHREVGRGHAEALMPAIATIVGSDHARISGIVVDIGPGSFTGLRIGIAAARALGLAWGVPVTGVGSLALIAAAVFAADVSLAEVTAVADAGRGQVYWQTFDREFTGRSDAAAGTPEAMTLPLETACAGPGAILIPGAACLDPAPPRAATLRYLPRAMSSLPPVPLYLRAPDAIAA